MQDVAICKAELEHAHKRHTFLNRSRTREAPTPTNISTNSEPEMEKNGVPASPAMALASSVLPVPGHIKDHFSHKTVTCSQMQYVHAKTTKKPTKHAA